MSASRTVTYLTVGEAAEVLRLSPITVMKRCRAGAIPATKPLGIWLIPADALTELLEARSNARPGADPPAEKDASA